MPARKGMRPFSGSSRYRSPAFRSMNNAGSHMFVTEAQSLDDALDIIASKRTHIRGRRRGMTNKKVDEAFGYSKREKPKVTLPVLKFMREAS